MTWAKQEIASASEHVERLSDMTTEDLRENYRAILKLHEATRQMFLNALTKVGPQ